MRQDARAQAAATAHPVFRIVRERAVHPVAGTAFLRAKEPHSLDLKFLADEPVQVDSSRENVAAHRRWMVTVKTQIAAQGGKHFHGEKGDLPLVVGFEIEESIPLQSATCNALDPVDLQDRVLSRRLAVMSKIIVTRRQEQMGDMDHDERVFWRLLNEVPGGQSRCRLKSLRLASHDSHRLYGVFETHPLLFGHDQAHECTNPDSRLELTQCEQRFEIVPPIASQAAV